MPLFLRELNELADRIQRSNLTCYLHTAAPSDAAPTTGRVSQGGGLYASGATVTPANISAAVNGDITVTADIDFGIAAGVPGTVIGWSLFRGNDSVAFGTLPSTTLGNGDSFKINANSLSINSSTT